MNTGSSIATIAGSIAIFRRLTSRISLRVLVAVIIALAIVVLVIRAVALIVALAITVVVVVVVVAADAFVCLSTEAHLLARRKQKKRTQTYSPVVTRKDFYFHTISK